MTLFYITRKFYQQLILSVFFLTLNSGCFSLTTCQNNLADANTYCSNKLSGGSANLIKPAQVCLSGRLNYVCVNVK